MKRSREHISALPVQRESFYSTVDVPSTKEAPPQIALAGWDAEGLRADDVFVASSASLHRFSPASMLCFSFFPAAGRHVNRPELRFRPGSYSIEHLVMTQPTLFRSMGPSMGHGFGLSRAPHPCGGRGLRGLAPVSWTARATTARVKRACSNAGPPTDCGCCGKGASAPATVPRPC